VPARGQGPVSDSPSPTITRVIKSGWSRLSVGVRDAVAQLTALMNTAGGFGRGVAADPPGKENWLEEARAAPPLCLQSCQGIPWNTCPRDKLGTGPPGAVAGTGDIDGSSNSYLVSTG